MIVCPTCKHRNPEGAQTCAACSGSLAGFSYRACPACDALNAAENLFCHRCLTPLGARPGATQVTSASAAEEPPSAEAAAELPAPSVIEKPGEREPQAAERPDETPALAAAAPDEPAPPKDSLAEAADSESLAAETLPQAAAPEAMAPETSPPQDDGPSEGQGPEALLIETEAEAVSVDATLPILEQDIVESPTLDTAAPESSKAGPVEEASQASDDEADVADVAAPPAEPQLPAQPATRAEAEGASTSGASASEAPEVEQAAIDEMSVWMARDSAPAEQLYEASEAPARDEPDHDQKEPPKEALTEAEPAMIASDGEAEELGIPIEMAVSLPHRAGLALPLGPTDADHRDAELFQRIALESASLDARAPSLGSPEARPALTAGSRGRDRVGRFLLRLLVLLAALTPLITGSLSAPWIQPRDPVRAAAQAMGAIPKGAAVLIAFDYGPSYAGEIEPLAETLLRQLADNSVHTLALSTLPTGPAQAERVYSAVTRQVPSYAYGQDYAILGFLPGGDAGLRMLRLSFTTAFQADHLGREIWDELPVAQQIADLQDLDRIILLSEDGRSVQSWIEQVGGSNVPLHAFVSARVEPLLQPYLQSGQLETLVGAADSTGEYQIAAGVPRDQLKRVDTPAVLLVLLVVIAIVTNAIWLSGQARAGAGRGPRT